MTAQTTNRQIDLVLSKLDKVKPNGANKWTACCPAHDDNSPSLSLTEASDGTVLFRCWVGCKPDDVVSSAGLKWSNFYPGNLSFAEQLGYKRKSLEAARDHCRLLMDLAKANAGTLDVDDLIVAGNAELDLPRIETEIQVIDERLGQARPDTVFIPDARDYVRLPESFRRTVVGRLAARVSHCLEFPEASAALALLRGLGSNGTKNQRKPYQRFSVSSSQAPISTKQLRMSASWLISVSRSCTLLSSSSSLRYGMVNS
ncbi:virulence-associated protein E (plasmid) [Pseudomonas aeruginosa]|nr:virulence-associated protein E [Pseudomonas aeruginosa]